MRIATKYNVLSRDCRTLELHWTSRRASSSQIVFIILVMWSTRVSPRFQHEQLNLYGDLITQGPLWIFNPLFVGYRFPCNFSYHCSIATHFARSSMKISHRSLKSFIKTLHLPLSSWNRGSSIFSFWPVLVWVALPSFKRTQTKNLLNTPFCRSCPSVRMGHTYDCPVLH